MLSVLIFDQPLSLGQRVRLKQVARGWRQFDVAVTAHVSPADVSMLERDLSIPNQSRARILSVVGVEPNAG